MIKINDRYIDEKSIDIISKTYYYSGLTEGPSIRFYIILKGRDKEYYFDWILKHYSGETKETIFNKVDYLRNKLAKLCNENKTVITLDGEISLAKEPIKLSKEPIKKNGS